jgi:predicted permease
MLPIIAAISASIAVGVWAEHHYGGRAGLAARRSMLVVLYAVLPPVTFFNLARADLDVDAGLGIGFGLIAITTVAFGSWAIAARWMRLPRASVGAIVCCALVANTGYLGYPVVAALLGFDALSEAVAYDVLVSSPALLIGAFSVGAAFGARAGEGAPARTRAFFTRNPALYAAIAAVFAPDALAPDVLVDASRIAIVAVLPLGFFAVGAALAEESEEGRVGFPPRLDRPIAAAVALRLAVAPGLLYAISLPWIELPDTYLLLAAMPCGLNTIIVSHAYGLDLRVAAGAITWSTALAVVALSVGAAIT